MPQTTDLPDTRLFQEHFTKTSLRREGSIVEQKGLPMPNTHQVCENCRFFQRNSKGTTLHPLPENEGKCRRYPAQFSATDYHHLYRFPTVRESGWCGEWRPILESGNISAYEEE